MSTEAMQRASGGATRLEALRLELRDFLVVARRMIDDEIRSYPKPIPRCDAQFNFLYEQRSRLSQWLARTDAPPSADEDSTALTDSLLEFAASAPVTGNALELALRERVKSELARFAKPR
jgi:hypothetical protein